MEIKGTLEDLQVQRTDSEVTKIHRHKDSTQDQRVQKMHHDEEDRETGSDNRDTGKSTRSRSDARNKQETQEKEEN
jgi:hypothetical protein